MAESPKLKAKASKSQANAPNPQANAPKPQPEKRTMRYSARAFKMRKSSFLNRIVPISLVPIATTNTLLIMGSNKTVPMNDDLSCRYPLPLFLLLTGVISMGLTLLGVTARYIVDWIFENRFVSNAEKRLISFLEALACAMTGVQICMLTMITCLLFYMLPTVQFNHKFEKHYCQHGIVVFSAVLMGVTWVFLLIAIVAFFYITFVSNKQAKKAQKKAVQAV